MTAAGVDPKDSFVHLHVHTEYSMLDGAARLQDLFSQCQQAGMPAIAMTDHGNLYGGYDFWNKATAAGVKPIIGIEAYLAPEHRKHRQPVRWGSPGQSGDDISGAGAYTHMTLLAETTEGMHNLFRLSSLASIEGYFRKPRMDRELLAQYAKGIIATTGCPSGEVQTRLRLGQYRQAVEAAAAYRDIFGPDNFFVEIMDHGLDIELRVRDGLRQIAAELSLPWVVTNDSHYTRPSDAQAHEVLLCVQTGSNLADPGRFKFDGTGYYVKSPAEMRAVSTAGEWQAGCDSTLLIAERCEVAFTKQNLMPKYPVPEGETEESCFRAEVWRGMERRYPGGYDEQRRQQAEYEMGIITTMGFCSYFLVVADFIMWAKRNGIRVGPGRGSAAGSIVAYALGITDLDPLNHGLVFERFLNPERVSMPDIDIDFDERRRGDVIRYVTEKYGDDRVAQIITYGTIKAKAAVKDATRVLGYPYALGDRITKAFPPAVMGKDIPLTGVFDPAHPRYGEAGEIRALYEAESEVRQVIDTAKGLEGLIRQAGVHAAGVIMSSEPIIDRIPVWKREADGAIITQFDYPACESLGLLKMDFLGLRNLTVLDDAVAGIKDNRGQEIVLEHLPLDDKPTYELLARGDTLGIFQFDGGPMRALLRSMRPDNFEDISAVGALYRPGPMGANAHNEYADRKNGRKPVVPIHPELAESLAEVLGSTYGLIVYQEQVMSIAQVVAGYSLGSADLLRRAMGKKKKEILDKEFEPFAAGMKANGYSDSAIKTLWDILVPFSDYAFNKAHSAAYGVVSYWTAYLKANYPAEYMAALLTSISGDKDKSALYLSECRRMGIKVLPPDVNASAANFTPVGADIRFGLAAIRNVGINVVDAIVATRRSKGAFTSFADFLRKVPVTVCNKRVIESLVKAGAFDSLGHPRKGLVLIHEQSVDQVIDVKRQEAAGQDTLFGDDAEAETMFDIPVPEGEWEKSVLLGFEREMLGLYVSDHPLLGLEHVLATGTDCSIAQLLGSTEPGAEYGEPDRRRGGRDDGQVVAVGGILSGLTRKVTKQGNTWAQATLEDLEGAIEVLFFPATYQTCAAYLAEDAILVVKGRLDRRDEVPKLIAMDVKVPDTTPGEGGPFVVEMPVARCVAPVVEQLREVLRTHPGATEVHLRLAGKQKTTVVRLDDKLRVSPSPALLGDLKQLLGPGCAGMAS
ncbi:MAG TPA: DNA polymerase III subunit alpha [Streptosporangiaceae bacterium]|jgi:DNA polymerase-3 subunit alpha|nr:DNA polymerase III subunit alpha [Streptosporangiaceae bacterium]